jgi:hypothetical protein
LLKISRSSPSKKQKPCAMASNGGLIAQRLRLERRDLGPKVALDDLMGLARRAREGGDAGFVERASSARLIGFACN